MTKTYKEYQEKRQNKLSKILEKNKVFFAFSEKQLAEGLEKIKEKRENIVPIMGDGLIPKKNIEAYRKDMLEWSKSNHNELMKIDRSEVIKYELSNHECYYTGDVSSVFEMLQGDGFTFEEIKAVYQKERCNHND